MISPTLIENVFKSPDDIREFGLTVKYRENENRYLGKRSDLLEQIAPQIPHTIACSVLGTFYNYEEYRNLNIKTFSFFYLIQKDECKEGAIHQDKHDIIANVYLSKNSIENGTSIFKQNREFLFSGDTDWENLYSNNHYSEKEVRERNSQFTEIINFKHLYNSMSVSSGYSWHKGNVNNLQEDRLTIVSFIDFIPHSLELRKTPFHI